MRDPETIEPDLRTVRLANGWSASVVTGVSGAISGTAATLDLPGTEEWRSLLEGLIDDPTSLREYQVLKYSDKGKVFRARLTWSGGALDVVCKQSPARGWRRRLFAAWRPSAERVNFNRGLALLRAGIAAALPLALLERRAGLRRRAWLVTQFVPHAVDLDQVALALLPRLDPRRQRAVKDAIIAALVDVIDRLLRRGIGHRDLKASNIVLTHWDSRPEPVRAWLVDLEGLRLRGRRGVRRAHQPLIRLAASLLDYSTVTRTDFCRFVHAYLARSGRRREEWKQCYGKLADQAIAYQRGAQRRSTGKLDGYGGYR